VDHVRLSISHETLALAQELHCGCTRSHCATTHGVDGLISDIHKGGGLNELTFLFLVRHRLQAGSKSVRVVSTPSAW
jgi:hypothetical protein